MTETPGVTETRARPARRRPNRLVRVLVWLALRIVPVPLVIVLWEVLARRADDISYPPPTQIVHAMRAMWLGGPASHLWLGPGALDNVPGSVERLLTAWVLAGVAGVLGGLALGRSRRLYGYVRPLIHFGYAIPPIMLLPFFLALFGGGTSMQLGTILFGIVWPVLLNSAEGARSVDPTQLEIARVFRFSAAQRIGRVLLPSAAPKIFAGLRVSLSLALILMVVSEMKGSTSGIGFQLLDEQRNFDNPGVWGGIVLLGVLGTLLNALFGLAERRVLAWHDASGGTS
ncbi:ABC transporter permease [Actinomadura rupiterrae]|uniref:ABC transporter permease n=1 Tax=Actinomadura rupiterrae TaxID=559627 RepID=UPI0020A53F7D|nr:ABC transporter permease [Actinomadura rupiterrae]MCP2339008.1 ABC-type nitrate/sulfonate/bicarbonate transport system permease component [Actinomadura rupiterrae]